MDFLIETHLKRFFEILNKIIIKKCETPRWNSIWQAYDRFGDYQRFKNQSEDSN